ncbi:MAG: DPP IV N-terminal domain-containing protein [Bacteroidota bacterium]|nr:DPP IV N-terminal domain-containing protein [Bacteroidota bacterium]MDP4233161.1 DPP IV N-terminal domain-containing protein [Bacteroidota bacterium]MDP4287352.1 DPP IV N-terminal domain-containing protein [Bacteroidota bacterium]
MSSSSYTLRTLKMSPIYVLSADDNGGIDASRQFAGAKPLPDSCHYIGEQYLQNIMQLTFEGENAEAYLSPDDKYLTFQAHGVKPNTCDQIYMMTIDGKNVKRISTGKGRTTCSYFYPGGDTILYASTHEHYDGACPPQPDMSQGYVWPLDGGYDIYLADTTGKQIGQLTHNEGIYDAEATVSPKGDRIVFTSTRSGDIELWSMKLDGTGLRQLTHEEGYDGGAYFSPDGKEIVYRASRPQGEALTEYRALLKKGLVKPTELEIWVMNADGSNKRQVTHLNAASFAPYWHPDGKRIIFSSNYLDKKHHRDFELFMIDKDGTHLKRVTTGGGFNSFPMFTRDGKKLVFCSNRNGSHPHNTNIFVADWTE